MFIHGDLQIAHVFVDGDEDTGIIDWSEASQGDALFDLATLTLAHYEHLDHALASYGTDVDRDARGDRSQTAAREVSSTGGATCMRAASVDCLGGNTALVVRFHRPSADARTSSATNPKVAAPSPRR